MSIHFSYSSANQEVSSCACAICSMSEAEAAWIAGILEGEGSFVLVPRKWKRPKNDVDKSYYAVRLSMTDADVVNRIALLVGRSGAVKKRELRNVERKHPYVLTINSKQSVECVISAVFP